WIGKSEGTLIKFKLENVKPKVKLKFNPRIIQEILNGESFLTFRLEHKNISKGDVCEFLNSKDNKKFAEAKIVNVNKKKFKDINPSEWKHERFTTRQEMYKTYEKYYKKPVNENTDIYIYEFKLIKEDYLEVFTTRTDTLYGATFLVIAPEHPKVLELVKNTKYEDEVKKFINKVVLEDKFSRTAEDKEKYGMFIGKYAVHPLTHEKIPIYIANFVLLDYGTGIIMAVPAHDQRDFEFAKKYKIPIKVVITPKDKKLINLKKAYLDEGILINSDKFNNMESKKAINEISKYLANLKLGKKTTQYKLRDWLISRQRYWGTPIPIIYCQNCGIVPVLEKDLPVRLPEDVKFTGEGNPLASSKTFINVKCIKCGKMAKRETDTMDTFVDSSWYFLRYCDPDNNKLPFSKDNINYFMPVNQYTGGIEHAILHLLYARFLTKALRDLRLLKFNEPFLRLVNQGMVLKNGEVMSKSKGNIVDPMAIINKYGADTLRTFILFIASPEKEFNWSDEGIEGIFRFLNRFYALQENISKKSDDVIESKLNKLIKKVTQDVEEFRFNNAIISIMEFSDYIKKHNYDKDVLEKLILLISPFAPHLGEEIWEK
ncbi:MAG: class I tRNA ligase family protein, partial [Nanoarchaeota archaeon]